MASTENAYNSPVTDPDDAPHVNPPQSYGKRMIIGFMIGAALPLGTGTYALLQSQIHAELNPSGGFVSGGVPFFALLLIFIASPLLGIVGAIVFRSLRPT